MRTPSIVLANLVLDENIMPEIVQRGLTPENLTAALVPLIGDTPARKRQLDAFDRLDGIMGIGRASAGIQAADIVLTLAQSRNSPEKPT